MAEKYALINCVNGNFAIHSEYTTKDAGIVAFYQRAAVLWNADDVITARLNLVDENLFVVDGKYSEAIDRSIERDKL